MTELDATARARIMASKAEYDKERAEVADAELASRQEEEAASFTAGRDWALSTATYEEMIKIRKEARDIFAFRYGEFVETLKGHLSKQFREGVKSVLDDLKKE